VTTLKERREAFLARVAAFARERVAPGAAKRDRDAAFDRALWRDLGATGLFGAALPAAMGGLGLDVPAVSAALTTLAREGGDLSLCISLTPVLNLTHLQLGRLGTEAQRERFLPPLLSGAWVGAVAISELPHGANPKHLETGASRRDGAWVIEGRKAFVTNGTEADLYLVLAITSQEGEHKGFSAFLVERKTPGVTIETRMPLEFVRAAPHAVIGFHEVVVPESNRLGRLHGALDQISRVMRIAEDTISTATLAGHLARTLSLAAAHGGAADPARAEALGDLRVEAEAARLHAEKLAPLWQGIGAEEAGDAGSGWEAGVETLLGDETFLATLLGARAVAERFTQRLEALLAEASPEAGSDLERAVRDLQIAKIGGRAARAQRRRLGERIARRDRG
jgi:alkylation response protein AidB-like acyl-CoA dehydrogenase